MKAYGAVAEQLRPATGTFVPFPILGGISTFRTNFKCFFFHLMFRAIYELVSNIKHVFFHHENYDILLTLIGIFNNIINNIFVPQIDDFPR